MKLWFVQLKSNVAACELQNNIANSIVGDVPNGVDRPRAVRARPLDLRGAELSGRRAERFECACSVPSTYDQSSAAARAVSERTESTGIPESLEF